MEFLTSEFTSCLLCNSQKIVELKGYQNNFLVKCSECTFVFCYKRPSAEELVQHYNLYSRAKPISPITIKRYHALLDEMEKYKMTSNLIDVGCGDGFFLEEAQKRGWNVYGTEFTDAAIEVCEKKGIRMNKAPISTDQFPPGYFDVITSFEVIEHINNPVEEITAFHKLLRKGGLVYITTPNFNSISRDILSHHWNIIGYPEHLSYYTRRTLRDLLANNGFNMVKSTSTGISINRMKVNAKSGQGSDTNTDEILRTKAEKNFAFYSMKATVNWLLNLFRKGDSIKAFFIKQ
jgi:2-polyprenyl-3-methyl-5-hydroxy-6-metoxy-1,4-benzoquinol methylase